MRDSAVLADDTCVGVAQLLYLLRDDLALLKKWVRDNKLTIDTPETGFILISSTPKLRKIEEKCYIHKQGESIYF